MRVLVNQIPVDLAPGMQVRHAIVAALGSAADLPNLVVCDRWGNRVGLDGALSDGEQYQVTSCSQSRCHG